MSGLAPDLYRRYPRALAALLLGGNGHWYAVHRSNGSKIGIGGTEAKELQSALNYAARLTEQMTQQSPDAHARAVVHAVVGSAPWIRQPAKAPRCTQTQALPNDARWRCAGSDATAQARASDDGPHDESVHRARCSQNAPHGAAELMVMSTSDETASDASGTANRAVPMPSDAPLQGVSPSSWPVENSWVLRRAP